MRDAEELVGKSAIPGVGRAGQHVLGSGVVQRVIELRDGAGGVAERRMGGDIGNALAIDVDLATVAQAFEVFLAGERPVGGADEILGFGPTRRRVHWALRRVLRLWRRLRRSLTRRTGRRKIRNRGFLEQFPWPLPHHNRPVKTCGVGTAKMAGTADAWKCSSSSSSMESRWAPSTA